MCECDLDLEEGKSCSKSFQWLFKRNYKEKDLQFLKERYQIIQKEERDSISKIQIEKDLSRTFPGIKYFQKGNQGHDRLGNILNLFAIYDPGVGYVQGMNFICAIFVYHAEDYIAFWLMAMVFEVFEMRDIYQPKLPGLKKHILIIDYLISQYLPQIHEKFLMMGIIPEMFSSPWLFSLFGVLIPMENYVSFYDKFLEQGWGFFYKIILSLLDKSEEDIMNLEGSDLLILLTSQNYKVNLKQQTEQEEIQRWEDILNDAETIKIDYRLISRMLCNYDPEEQQFLIQFSSTK